MLPNASEAARKIRHSHYIPIISWVFKETERRSRENERKRVSFRNTHEIPLKRFETNGSSGLVGGTHENRTAKP